MVRSRPATSLFASSILAAASKFCFVMRGRGVARSNMLPCHGRDRGFKSRRPRQILVTYHNWLMGSPVTGEYRGSNPPVTAKFLHPWRNGNAVVCKTTTESARHRPGAPRLKPSILGFRGRKSAFALYIRSLKICVELDDRRCVDIRPVLGSVGESLPNQVLC